MFLTTLGEAIDVGHPEIAWARVENDVELLDRVSDANFSIILGSSEGFKNHGNAFFSSKLKNDLESSICFWWSFRDSSIIRLVLDLNCKRIPNEKT